MKTYLFYIISIMYSTNLMNKSLVANHSSSTKFSIPESYNYGKLKSVLIVVENRFTQYVGSRVR